MNTPLINRPEPRVIRPPARDDRPPAGTSGARGDANGGPIGFWRAAPLIIALLAVVGTINVFSTLHDAARAGQPLPAWQPATWEATSVVSDFAGCVVIWLTLRLAPPNGRRWLGFIAAHLLGSIVFSAVHIAGMWALRVAVYAAAGRHYGLAPGDIPYEYRKDVLSYVGFAALFWLAPRLAAERSGQPPESSIEPAVREDWFDIREGARLLRVPIGDIIAVRAAGNYVEFLLGDGRRPLMRAPLADIEASLGANGFLRTHRSWIVNPARVQAIEPSGSGDHRLALDGGETAPVSRRFPEALERLREGR